MVIRMMVVAVLAGLAVAMAAIAQEKAPAAPTPAGDTAKAQQAASKPLVLYTLRVDDIFNRGHPARPRTVKGLLDLAEKYHAKVILNVIPRRLIESPNEGGAMVAELREALDRGHEVIQHGYSHTCSQCGDTGHQTYCTLLDREQPLEEEIRDLRLGKEMLEAAIGRRVFCYGPTGVDLSTPQLLTAVKAVGFISTTGEPSEAHEKLGLKVVPTWSDYAFGAKTQEEFDAAFADWKAEFEKEVSRAKATGTQGYVQIMVHDPYTRPAYENGATLKYIERIILYMQSRQDVEIKNVLSRDVLGLTDEDLKLPEPKYPDIFKRAKELNALKGELLTTQPSR